MQELISQILGYVRGAWRYRWIALMVAWCGAIGGWIFIAQMPDRYQSSARVFVDTNSLLQPLLRGLTIQPDPMQQVAMIGQMILNQDNLEKIIRMTDLDLNITSDAERNRLLTSLKNELHLNSSRANPSLYFVSYEHTNPVTARNVVQALVNVFIEEAQNTDQKSGASARDFLDQQIAQYEERLQEADRRLADFKRRNSRLMSGNVGNYYEKVAEQETLLENAKLALREAKWRHEELLYQLNSSHTIEDTLPEEEQTAVQNALASQDPRIAALEAKLDTLLLTYTEKHPSVMELKRLLSMLRERNRQDRALLQKNVAATATTLSANSVYGNLQVLTAEADAQVAALEARVEEYTKRLEDLRNQVNRIPMIEAELKELNRDYSTISAQHQALLERREAARLSKQVEQTTDGVRFRIVDPAEVPLKPSAPNRIVLNIVALVASIAAGLAIALGLHLLQPVFDDRQTLYRVVGLPVFGTVEIVRSPSQIRLERLRLIPFVVLTGALVAALILVIVMFQ
jgi:polysaccharide chain length determinant protein (PEP-CTERM system associated)